MDAVKQRQFSVSKQFTRSMHLVVLFEEVTSFFFTDARGIVVTLFCKTAQFVCKV